ncbi:hypothetical protein [Maribacter flavus]|uniref:Uncharacterized protein n=1 Tax=Maribacter flavus TaxID=1658664 RepID=A0A5B2TVI7_9FLAO|nr:hypothetical protein [Maribacter flavus]KAA2218259.1 hypothetical protein F0361_01165 [Maribacter flavus]
MREKVLEFLREQKGIPEERYNKAMELYRKSEGKSIPSVNYYSRAGFTKVNLQNICYDLQHLHGITDLELRAKVKKMEIVKDKTPYTLEAVLALMPEEVKAIVVYLANMPSGDYPTAILELWKPMQEYVEQHKSVFVHEDEVPFTEEEIFKTLLVSLEHWKDETGKVEEIGQKVLQIVKSIDVNGEEVTMTPIGSAQGEPLSDQNPDQGSGDGSGDDITDKDGKNIVVFATAIEEAPDNVKGGLKLREHFPFLSEKDCPDKLKILVADMLTAWIQYKENHAELVKVTNQDNQELSLTDNALYELAKETIEAFELNHAIWDELEYYRDNGQILGNHPIFADEVLKEKVASLTDAKLVTRRNTLRSYISRESKKLENNPEEDAAAKIRKKIKEYTQELNLVEERLA